jgi:ABC-type polysaccharide/polyol phosphate transport system ATPase subunit
MQPVIELQNVSKLYMIGRGSRSLRGALTKLPRRVLGRTSPGQAELWALRDVSFNVSRGESLGVLGHNGAGKTTMLKLLSSITYPTRGSIRVHGRLGSLIELGAGFHPEMTGRENVYLNGVILGMTRSEVARKFDSIIDFAGIERFIDTPVKRYSSGMYVRLAFAVAAHIDPAVLLVDEVLAVGDISFRAKCYRRMAELRENGTTVVLVSHDVYAIRDTCDRALLLWQGELMEEGPVEEVITAYLACMREQQADPKREATEHPSVRGQDRQAVAAARQVRLKGVVFYDPQHRAVDSIYSGDPLQVEVRYEALEPVAAPIFRMDFYSEGCIYTGYSTAYDGTEMAPLEGSGRVILSIDSMHVPPGVYTMSAVIAETYEHNLLDVHHQTYPLQVLRAQNARGELAFPHNWQQQSLDTEPVANPLHED